MRAARLAGSRSARNCAASCAVGRVPMTSRKARRRKTASEERKAGWMSKRLRRSKTGASMGDCADRGAGLSKVGLRARSAPVATPVAVTARKIANRDKRISIAELVYRSNPGGREKFWLCGGEEAMPPWVRWFVGFVKIARNVGNTGLLGFERGGASHSDGGDDSRWPSCGGGAKKQRPSPRPCPSRRHRGGLKHGGPLHQFLGGATWPGSWTWSATGLASR